MKPRTEEKIRLREAQGWPTDMDFETWNREEIEAAAAAGDLQALNKRMVLRLVEGRADWLEHEPLIRGSGFYARMRAGEALSLISASLLRQRNRRSEVPARSVVEALAWDLVARYLGHTSIFWEIPATSWVHNYIFSSKEGSIGFYELVEAEEVATRILRFINEERRHRGWAPLRANWPEPDQWAGRVQ